MSSNGTFVVRSKVSLAQDVRNRPLTFILIVMEFTVDEILKTVER